MKIKWELYFFVHSHDFHVDIKECSSNPCLNGGTCVDQVNGYLCNCQDGYQGVRCQTSKYSVINSYRCLAGHDVWFLGHVHTNPFSNENGAVLLRFQKDLLPHLSFSYRFRPSTLQVSLYVSLHFQSSNNIVSYAFMLTWSITFLRNFCFADWRFLKVCGDKLLRARIDWNCLWELIFAVSFSSSETSTQMKM